jgi:hypothetical protein
VSALAIMRSLNRDGKTYQSTTQRTLLEGRLMQVPKEHPHFLSPVFVIKNRFR